MSLHPENQEREDEARREMNSRRFEWSRWPRRALHQAAGPDRLGSGVTKLGLDRWPRRTKDFIFFTNDRLIVSVSPHSAAETPIAGAFRYFALVCGCVSLCEGTSACGQQAVAFSQSEAQK